MVTLANVEAGFARVRMNGRRIGSVSRADFGARMWTARRGNVNVGTAHTREGAVLLVVQAAEAHAAKVAAFRAAEAYAERVGAILRDLA